MIENPQYLTTQLPTYIGNKRALLSFIASAVQGVCTALGQEKLSICDPFCGSGATARLFKGYSNRLVVNDLEGYVYTLNQCYLANENQVDMKGIKEGNHWLDERLVKDFTPGFISRLYAPIDDAHIQKGERAFYTTRNANYIDTARQLMEQFPLEIRHFFLAPLLVEASIKSNTSGVFKGFYKNTATGLGQFGGNGQNALSRITSDIQVKAPILSNYNCAVEIYKQDANQLVKSLDQVDLAYIDPPYNQHPYGSNYFMLNLINDYVEPNQLSRVSGIPTDWNRSDYNKSTRAQQALLALCTQINARYLLISFNSDGFIKREEMEKMLTEIGEVETFEQKYNTFRGSRNLRDREIHVSEYLYLVKKG